VKALQPVIALLIVLAAIGFAVVWANPVSYQTPAGFVTRSGAELKLNGQPFRFSGANIYWGGLDENGRTGVNYPTDFRVQSALATAADMGETVVRCLSCGISTGSPDSVEPSLGVFNQTALRHIDYFIAEAQKYGIRLDIALTGNYSYYEGGYASFADWLGLSSPDNCPSAACASTFYTDLQAIDAFKQYISMFLNHVNVYTGVANKDNPTIVSWETGNEMPYGNGGQPEFTNWTGTISSYIKSIAPRQLVMDGALTLDPGDLLLPDVDIQSPHLYPVSTQPLKYVEMRVAAARQALVVGEYAWNSASATDLLSFLRYIRQTPSISGDIYWDLMPQNDDFGYVEHYDGYQLHFPGDEADVGGGNGAPALSPASDAPLVALLREHAYAMSGAAVPPYAVPPAPVITNVEHVASATEGTGNLIEWRGSPGAATYIVRSSAAGPAGPWQTVCSACTDTDLTPFLDSGAGPGPGLWYQVAAVNPGGVAGPGSAAFQVSAPTIDDNLDNFSATYSHSPSVTTDTSSPSLFQGDQARAESAPGAPSGSIVWRASGLRSVEAVAYYPDNSTPDSGAQNFSFLVSANGADWQVVPADDVQLIGGTLPGSGDLVPYVYTVDGIRQIMTGAVYVRIDWGAGTPGTAELGEVRITAAQPSSPQPSR
jgi:hypothetical protein